MINTINIEGIINKHMPNRKIKSIIDKGAIVKRIYKVTFEDDYIVYVKLNTNRKWLGVEQESLVIKYFKSESLPSPNLLFENYSNDIVDSPYIIESHIGGIKLCSLLETLKEEHLIDIYYNIGLYYKTLHGIKNNQAGIWDQSPNTIKYTTHPTIYMFKAEIQNGATLKAFNSSLITKHTYDRIISTWKNSLEYLMNTENSLIHISPFTWNIYIDDSNDCWEITKVMSMSDFMWWDAAYDVATIKWPPFGIHSNSLFNAFTRGYGKCYPMKRLLLYHLIHHICAVMGVYLEPNTEYNHMWKSSHRDTLDRYINSIIDNIDSL